MLDPASAAASGVATGQAPAHTPTPTSTNPSRRPAASGDGANLANLAGNLGNEIHDGPCSTERGGRFASPADALAGPSAPEPGAQATARQLPLLADTPVSPVPYGELGRLAKAAICRECRPLGYDWSAFLADRPQWRVTEIVHRAALQAARVDGLDYGPADLPTDTVLTAVQSVIEDWTANPKRRPSEAGFLAATAEYRANRAAAGERGRQARAAKTAERDRLILELAAAGVSDAEIGRRVGLNRSSVGRIRRKAEATPEPEPAAIDLPEAEPTPFPAPELPARERWPVNQFRGQTGVALDGAAARWLADWGRCYEADGLESELMAAIRSSAGPEVREPWAYLQQCIANRGDAWTVSPALLADVAIWGGTRALEYALTSIGGGYVTRPLAYLRAALRQAQARGRRHPNGPHNPVAQAVSLARRWAPALEIVGADAAVAAEAQAYQTRHLDSYRRRFGRLPWEPAEPDPPGDGENCCVGIGARGDDCLIPDLDSIAGESSPGPRDANATPAQPPVATSPVAAVQVQPEPEPETGAKREPAPSASKPPSPVATSPRRCPDPLGRRAPPGIPLADVADVACSEPGCGCLAYRRVGADPAPCPCHWTPTRRAYALRAMQVAA